MFLTLASYLVHSMKGHLVSVYQTISGHYDASGVLSVVLFVVFIYSATAACGLNVEQAI